MNKFEHISELKITATQNSSGKTIISDQFFTSPFKIMKPFPRTDGGLQIYLQTASAGIMADDEQLHDFNIEDNSTLELVSQSFEKIFKMDEDHKASRKITAHIGSNSTFIYTPLPCMPFAGSDFESSTRIYLKDSSSRLIYSDCICCGRKAHNETFDYRCYKNLIEIWQTKDQKNKLIYRDNTIFKGSDCGKFPSNKEFLQTPVMYDQYSHSGTMLFFGFNLKPADLFEKLKLESKLLYTAEKITETEKSPLASVTLTENKDIAIRILAHSAEQVQNLFDELKTITVNL